VSAVRCIEVPCRCGRIDGAYLQPDDRQFPQRRTWGVKRGALSSWPAGRIFSWRMKSPAPHGPSFQRCNLWGSPLLPPRSRKDGFQIPGASVRCDGGMGASGLATQQTRTSATRIKGTRRMLSLMAGSTRALRNPRSQTLGAFKPGSSSCLEDSCS
jgi:hypothetical protein